jgi:hypothetical protein
MWNSLELLVISAVAQFPENKTLLELAMVFWNILVHFCGKSSPQVSYFTQILLQSM